jgi:organic radical activating enzyme
MAGYLSEIFASVEGEGLFAGEPVVFARLAGCNLRCSYCDTQYALENPAMALVYEGATAREITNPVPAADLVELISDYFRDAATVVFTGGEPLLQADFLLVAMRDLRGLGYGIHLQTNGTLASALLQVRDIVDFVSMDIKLPSTQGGRDLSREHLESLRAATGKNLAVKIVVAPDAHDREIDAAVRLVGDVNRFIPVILQPAFVDSRPAVGADRLTAALAIARRHVHDARISIQMHKVIGAR